MGAWTAVALAGAAAVAGVDRLDCAAATTCAAAAALPIQIAQTPRIYVQDNVFTPAECLELVETGFALLEPAQVMGSDGKQKDATHYRTATTTTLPRKSSAVVDLFRKRMANLVLLPEEYGEELQLTRYTPGQKYEAHFDSSMLAGRLATVIVFLGVPAQGGQLAFPWAKRGEFASVAADGVSGRGRSPRELEGLQDAPQSRQVCSPANDSLLIEPRVGRAVLWFNHSPDLKRVGYAAMHVGCPVLEGEKLITQVFFDWMVPRTQNGVNEVFKAVGLQWLEPLYG